eukprot:6415829-Heterocapsa_arctica.AAC.1
MAQALTFIGLVACLNVPLGLGCAFYPGLYQASSAIYFYYILNLHILIAIAAMAKDLYEAVVCASQRSRQPRVSIRDTAAALRQFRRQGDDQRARSGGWHPPIASAEHSPQ